MNGSRGLSCLEVRWWWEFLIVGKMLKKLAFIITSGAPGEIPCKKEASQQGRFPLGAARSTLCFVGWFFFPSWAYRVWAANKACRCRFSFCVERQRPFVTIITGSVVQSLPSVHTTGQWNSGGLCCWTFQQEKQQIALGEEFQEEE